MDTKDEKYRGAEISAVWLDEAGPIPESRDRDFVDPEVDKYDLKPASHANWLGSLSFHDLQRLRAAVRKVHLHYMPAETYTDREADKLIEVLGPVVGERLLKREVDGKR
jgi:hypothetical protein